MKNPEIKTVYYDSLLEDEFSGTNITRIPLGDDYRYYSNNIFFRATAWFLYWIFAWIPILIYTKLSFHVRVKGKKNRRHLRRQGVFVYGNHTQIIDALTGQIYATPRKRTYIVCNQDTTSIKGIRPIVKMLGAIPTPEKPSEGEKYRECINKRIRQRCSIVIFPEAHIWPYYTHIRPFGDESFTFPAELGVPVIAMATTYRRRKIFKNRSPRVTIHLSKPFYPNMNLSLPERKAELRNFVYDYLVDKASEEENYEFVRYIKRPEAKK